MLTALITDDSGVERVKVKPYELVIVHSLVVSVADLRKRAMNALREAGFEPIDVDEEESRAITAAAEAQLARSPRWSKLRRLLSICWHRSP